MASGVTGALLSYDTPDFPFDRNIFYDFYNLFAVQPSDCLNYLAIHDGLTLRDKINLTIKNPSKKEALKIMKLAAAILFTSQGRIIWHGGDEIFRSKPLAEHDKKANRALTSENIDKEEGATHFHENSYQSPDYTNMLRWDRLENEFASFANDMLAYVKGLIKLRRNIPAFRYTKAENVSKGLQFLSGFQAETKSNQLLINTFQNPKLEKLKIKFINGPSGESYYFSGEVHKKNANPLKNKYFVTFDEFGNAEIEFSRKQIDDFDLRKWSKNNNLVFKLIKTPSKWDYLPDAYSDDGNNLISPAEIDTKFEVVINLSVKNFCAISPTQKYNKQYIAYLLDNTLENKISSSVRNDNCYSYKKMLVIHNAGKETLILHIEAVESCEKRHVIVDENHADIEPLVYDPENAKKPGKTNVKITKNNVTVPCRSTAVIGFTE